MMDHIELQLVDSPYVYKRLHIKINGHSLIDMVRQIEQPFADLEGRPHAAGQHDWVAGRACDLFDAAAHDVAVLGCTCGEIDCWPVYCRVKRLPGQVRWSGFLNPYRTPKYVSALDDPAHQRIVPWDYSALGCFSFDRKEYDAAFAALKPALIAERKRFDAERAELMASIEARQEGHHG